MSERRKKSVGTPRAPRIWTYLDYDMWTGPAPMRPYNSLVHPRGWRAFNEYGNLVGDDEANRLLRRPYPAPWVHPDPAKV